MENKQIVWGALGLISASALVFYLSRDSSVAAKFDPKVHSDERMLSLMEELKLEYTCIYVRHYNLIKRMQEQGTFQKQHIHDLKGQVEQEKADKFKNVVSQYVGFTPEIVNEWVAKNVKNAKIQKQIADLDKLYEDVYTHLKITDLGYDKELPERMTRERYIRIYRKIFATLRHDVYMKILEFKKS